MRQLFFAVSMVHMLLMASIGTLLLTKLSPELLSNTRLAWLSDPQGVIIGCGILAVFSCLPFFMLIYMDTVSFKDGKACAERDINNTYFLIKK